MTSTGNMTRRRMLNTSCGLMGLSLADWLAIRQAAGGIRTGVSKAKSCIVLFCWGGMSHLETFDTKPNAPKETRGEFKPIATATAGLQIGEHLPNTAKWTDEIAIVRSVHHLNSGHGKGMYWNMTGHAPPQPSNPANLPPSSNDWPSLGAMVSQFRKAAGNLPGAVQLPYQITNEHSLLAGQLGGWMGRSADPLVLRTPQGRPFNGKKYNAGGAPLRLPTAESVQQMQGRTTLLRQLNSFRAGTAVTAHKQVRQRAYDLLVNPKVRQAFNLNKEPVRVQEMYGDHLFGQSVLLARRLIETGIPIVTVMCAFDNLSDPYAEHWDTHHRNFPRLKKTMLPLFDRVFPALLADLQQRGTLDETLVVVIGDFGRTPKINKNAGRDHHPYCYSVAFAGGGVRGGQVFGSSDRIGAYPNSSPCGPADLHATIFKAMGIPRLAQLKDQLNRPHPICANGRPLPLF